MSVKQKKLGRKKKSLPRFSHWIDKKMPADILFLGFCGPHSSFVNWIVKICLVCFVSVLLSRVTHFHPFFNSCFQYDQSNSVCLFTFMPMVHVPFGSHSPFSYALVFFESKMLFRSFFSNSPAKSLAEKWTKHHFQLYDSVGNTLCFFRKPSVWLCCVCISHLTRPRSTNLPRQQLFPM